jgi:hypothetical protein
MLTLLALISLHAATLTPTLAQTAPSVPVANPTATPPAELPIQELDMGACWIQPVLFNENPQAPALGYKVASFGAGDAFSIFHDTYSADTLKLWLKTQLEKRFSSFAEQNYYAALHCYSSGYALSFQIERPGEQPICINARSQSGALHDFELLALRPDTQMNNGDFCLGIEERTLGMTLKTSELAHVEAIRNIVERSPLLSTVVEKIDYIPNLFFATVRLKEAYAFRELEAQKLLESDAAISEHASGFWVNHMNTIEGESLPLFGGKTLAY